MDKGLTGGGTVLLGFRPRDPIPVARQISIPSYRIVACSPRTATNCDPFFSGHGTSPRSPASSLRPLATKLSSCYYPSGESNKRLSSDSNSRDARIRWNVRNGCPSFPPYPRPPSPPYQSPYFSFPFRRTHLPLFYSLVRDSFSGTLRRDRSEDTASVGLRRVTMRNARTFW